MLVALLSLIFVVCFDHLNILHIFVVDALPFVLKLFLLVLDEQLLFNMFLSSFPYYEKALKLSQRVLEILAGVLFMVAFLLPYQALVIV